jgi:hypothetical protein
MLKFVSLRTRSRCYALRIVSSDSLREAGPSISCSTNSRRRFITVLVMTRHCTQARWIRYSSSHLRYFHFNLILSPLCSWASGVEFESSLEILQLLFLQILPSKACYMSCAMHPFSHRPNGTSWKLNIVKPALKYFFSSPVVSSV